MELLDKKHIKIEGLRDFAWNPKAHQIAYWVPELNNSPARVTVLGIPDREIIRTKNLFNVSDVSFGVLLYR